MEPVLKEQIQDDARLNQARCHANGQRLVLLARAEGTWGVSVNAQDAVFAFRVLKRLDLSTSSRRLRAGQGHSIHGVAMLLHRGVDYAGGDLYIPYISVFLLYHSLELIATSTVVA